MSHSASTLLCVCQCVLMMSVAKGRKSATVKSSTAALAQKANRNDARSHEQYHLKGGVPLTPFLQDARPHHWQC